MPYIDPYTGGLANAINSAGDRVNGALDEVSAYRSAEAARGRAETEQNRALHPETQNWLKKVMSGEMTPAQAAVAAHGAIDAQQVPMGPVPEASPGFAGGKLADDGAPSNTALASYGAPNSGPSLAQPQSYAQPPPPPEPRTPFKVRDAADLAKLAPLADATRNRNTGMTFEERKALEGVKTGGRIEVEGVKGAQRSAGARSAQDFKLEYQKRAEQGIGDRQKNQLAQKRWDTTLRMETALAVANAQLEQIRMGHGDSTALAILKLKADQLNTDKGIVKTEVGSNAEIFDDPEAAAIRDAKMKEIDEGTIALKKAIEQLENKPSAGSGSVEITSKKKGPAAAVPAPGTAPKGEVAPPSQALPDPFALPTRKDKGPAAQSINMKFPDGKVHPVSRDKVEAARRKGGKEI